MMKILQKSTVLAVPAHRRNFMSTLAKKLPVIPEPSQGIPVSVHAYYVARGIDYKLLNTKVTDSLYKDCKQDYQTKSVTITIDESLNQYVTIFRYGSVVFFNIPEDQHIQHQRQINEVAMRPIAEGLQHRDNYKLFIHENLDKPSNIKSQHLNIRHLDRDNLTIVSTIMAHTVALDYHAMSANKLLASFTKLNESVRDTGSSKGLNAKYLHNLISLNNSVFTSVLLDLGIFEGTDAAWEDADYSHTWEVLRKDFEVEYRFKDLERKIKLIKSDGKFFTEMLHDGKSTRAEWIIIIIIAFEMCIGAQHLVMDHLIHQKAEALEAATAAASALSGVV